MPSPPCAPFMAGHPVVTNMLPLILALNKMGEPLYGHETPDGYPRD